MGSVGEWTVAEASVGTCTTLDALGVFDFAWGRASCRKRLCKTGGAGGCAVVVISAVGGDAALAVDRARAVFFITAVGVVVRINSSRACGARRDLDGFAADVAARVATAAMSSYPENLSGSPNEEIDVSDEMSTSMRGGPGFVSMPTRRVAGGSTVHRVSASAKQLCSELKWIMTKSWSCMNAYHR